MKMKYQDMLDEYESVIQTQTHNRTDWMKKFYYPGLYIILDDVMVSEEGRMFKINLVFWLYALSYNQ